MKIFLGRGDIKERPLCTDKATKAMIRHLSKDHEQQISVGGRRSSSVVVRHMPWAVARVAPSKRAGRFMGRVDAVLVVAVVNHMLRAAARTGPSKHVDRPARPITLSKFPGPAH